MSARPRLLDLFCKAGGAGMGYHRAGFEVLGVDIEPQPNYPFVAVQADAIEFLRMHGNDFDAVHASPPCQAHTTMSNRFRGRGGRTDTHVDLIGQTRDMLLAKRPPFVIENVPGARKRMLSPITLHGGMFGLGVYRPRLFEIHGVSVQPPPKSGSPPNPVGVYGKLDGRRIWTRADGSEQRAAKTLRQARLAMGIDWMAWDELTQAIPPAYTEHIGKQIAAHLTARMAA